MQKFRYISKISVWVVNIMIIILAAGGLFSYYMLFRMDGEGFRPDSTEGMTRWSTSVSMNVGRYILAEVTEYEAEEGEEGIFSDYLELRMPYPEVRHTNPNTSDFDILNETDLDVDPYMANEQWAPVYYRIKGHDEMVRLRWIFGILVTASLAFSFFILIVLRRFLTGLSRGEFFTRTNYKRLIILSIPAFLIPLFEYIAGKVALGFFWDHFRVINGGVLVSIHPNLTPVIFGVIFLLMAGMVYEGSRLKEDQDLTI